MVTADRFGALEQPPRQQNETLTRLQAAYKELIGCIRQLQAERDLAQPQSNWRHNLDQLIHRLETDDELLYGLAEEALARLDRRP